MADGVAPGRAEAGVRLVRAVHETWGASGAVRPGAGRAWTDACLGRSGPSCLVRGLAPGRGAAAPDREAGADGEPAGEAARRGAEPALVPASADARAAETNELRDRRAAERRAARQAARRADAAPAVLEAVRRGAAALVLLWGAVAERSARRDEPPERRDEVFPERDWPEARGAEQGAAQSAAERAGRIKPGQVWAPRSELGAAAAESDARERPAPAERTGEARRRVDEPGSRGREREGAAEWRAACYRPRSSRALSFRQPGQARVPAPFRPREARRQGLRLSPAAGWRAVFSVARARAPLPSSGRREAESLQLEPLRRCGARRGRASGVRRHS